MGYHTTEEEGWNSMRRGGIRWALVLRRCGAFFLATLGAALLLSGAGGQASGALRALGDNPAFLSAVLRGELGRVESGGVMDELELWGRLVVDQSALLRWGLSGAGGDQAEPAPPAGTPAASAPPAATPSEPEGEPSAAPAADPSSIVEQTLVASSGAGYEQAQGIYLYNRTDLPVDMQAAWAAGVDITLPDEGPQILIVHTHGSEAYTPDGADVYVPSDNNSRTLDENYNMVRVGDEMAAVFEEMGLRVLHDRTLYDYPAYNGAYSRSGAAVEGYLQEYPSIRIVLDVHRDALVGSDGTIYKAVTTVDGASAAQVMLVLGSGAGHPDWMKNLALAMRIQKSMDTLYPTLARPMTLRSSVYNQNLSAGSLLVEVGTHGNTLQEALRGARYFARAAGQVLLALPGSE